jgi:aerobic-type carbon monoxide dehydrogenase small subunit (CoxS/CutS family)
MELEDHETGLAASDPPGRVIALTVNGLTTEIRIEDREVLLQVLRGSLRLTGSHGGCYGGDCGACTVEIDGRIAKSCMVMAASVDGCRIVTIEGFADGEGLDPIQRAFWEHDAFQCGFCLPGHLFAIRDLLRRTPEPSEDEIRLALSGNICRCTGYVNLVTATMQAARDAAALSGSGSGRRAKSRS